MLLDFQQVLHAQNHLTQLGNLTNVEFLLTGHFFADL
jgi:hypothetical protein